MDNILTDEETKKLESMTRYWNEVVEREDTSTLKYELQSVVDILGTKILWIIEDYIKLYKESNS